MAHRVLRMVNTSTKKDASRDFAALFILDPAAEPLVPARCHLATPRLYRMSLGGSVAGNSEEKLASAMHLKRGAIDLILKYLGILLSAKARHMTRMKMLQSQLQPSGRLGLNSEDVYCVGNGCFTMIGWLNTMIKQELEEWEEDFIGPSRRTDALNVPPREIDRGLSETLSLPSSQMSTVFDLEECKHRKTDPGDQLF